MLKDNVIFLLNLFAKYFPRFLKQSKFSFFCFCFVSVDIKLHAAQSIEHYDKRAYILNLVCDEACIISNLADKIFFQNSIWACAKIHIHTNILESVHVSHEKYCRKKWLIRSKRTKSLDSNCTKWKKIRMWFGWVGKKWSKKETPTAISIPFAFSPSLRLFFNRKIHIFIQKRKKNEEFLYTLRAHRTAHTRVDTNAISTIMLSVRGVHFMFLSLNQSVGQSVWVICVNRANLLSLSLYLVLWRNINIISAYWSVGWWWYFCV